ncbi:MAG: translation elongation factor 4 [Elusimicrobiota bacterium]
MKNIRNFSIIAHIDHGKSTLSDRLIQASGLVSERDFREQLLDNMDLERERGITIKSQTIALPYKDSSGKEYTLNLIDTPGHVDFSYEVSRALASCEGALLLVDATQGVEAQTIVNLFMAMEQDLKIIPVINKIDLASADVKMAKRQIEDELALDPETSVLCSAKTGDGIDDIFNTIVKDIPPPEGNPEKPLKALIFDAHYDPYRGAIASCRIFDGSLKPGDNIRLFSNETVHRVDEVGCFHLNRHPLKKLSAGQVGYISAGIKKLGDTRIGDTITLDSRPAKKPLSGFKEPRHVVFSSVYPMSTDEYQELREALEKYELNDSSVIYQKDSSAALGQGFRCGFLGLLHLEIFQQRLEREYDRAIVMTVPSVEYKFNLKNGQTISIDNPQHYPDPASIESSEEPYIKASLFFPDKYVGPVMQLCLSRRGVNMRTAYPSPGRVELSIEMPLAEAIYDFYDTLKTITQGHGSLDYELEDYRHSELVKLDILVNGERVDPLSMIVFKDKAREWGVKMCSRLKEEIPRHQFKIAVQGAIGGQIISRSTISPYRKDVTEKLYGGDITRKQKLLKKQKKGKKKMKMAGSVNIPQSAFSSILKAGTED